MKYFERAIALASAEHERSKHSQSAVQEVKDEDIGHLLELTNMHVRAVCTIIGECLLSLARKLTKENP